MYGWLTAGGRRRKNAPARVFLCGLSVWKLEVGSADIRTLKRAGRSLRKAGVTRVLTPPGEEWQGALERMGLPPVDTAALCRAAAAPLALQVLKLRGWEPGRAVVELKGEELTLPLVRAAEELAGQVSRLMISVPRDGEELAEHLRRSCGLPVLLSGALRPALTVDFDAGETGRGSELCLGGTRPDLKGAELWSPAVRPPPECDLMPLLAAFWESGRLSRSDFHARAAENGANRAEMPLDRVGQRKYNT